MSTYQYYVYAYLREDGSPYYIGKGKNNRAYGKHRNNLTPKDISRIVFLETNLSEIGALALERRYVLWYGRKDVGTGILRNMTDGGDGCSGLKFSDEIRQKMSSSQIGKKPSAEQRQKQSAAMTGRKLSAEHVEKVVASNRGKKRSAETRQKMSASATGKIISAEQRQKQSLAMTGRKPSAETRQKMSAAQIGKKRSMI